MALVGTLEGQFQHPDHRIHRRADFMAHGREKGAFGSVCLVGAFLGSTQFVEQLAPVTDVDPAADNALNFAVRVAIGKNPVVDRQFLPVNMQGAIEDQRVTFRDHPLVVGVVLRRLRLQSHVHLHHALANHFLAFDPEHLQVTVIAGLQQALAVAYVNRVRRLIDQCAHELELVVEGPFGHLPVFDLAAHVGVPGQGNQQQQPRTDDDLCNQLVVIAPVAVGGGCVTPPAAVDHAHFVRGNTQQCLVQD